VQGGGGQDQGCGAAIGFQDCGQQLWLLMRPTSVVLSSSKGAPKGHQGLSCYVALSKVIPRFRKLSHVATAPRPVLLPEG
jgi:hypothetical protein